MVMQGHLPSPTPPGPHVPIGVSPLLGYVATREPSPLESREPEPREWWDDDESEPWEPVRPTLFRVTAAVLSVCLLVAGVGTVLEIILSSR
jgi:hypothetical protein